MSSVVSMTLALALFNIIVKGTLLIDLFIFACIHDIYAPRKESLSAKLSERGIFCTTTEQTN